MSVSFSTQAALRHGAESIPSSCPVAWSTSCFSDRGAPRLRELSLTLTIFCPREREKVNLLHQVSYFLPGEGSKGNLCHFGRAGENWAWDHSLLCDSLLPWWEGAEKPQWEPHWKPLLLPPAQKQQLGVERRYQTLHHISSCHKCCLASNHPERKHSVNSLVRSIPDACCGTSGD